MVDEKYISRIVESVIKNIDVAPDKNLKGVFETMDEALEAVSKAYIEFKSYTVEQREKMISDLKSADKLWKKAHGGTCALIAEHLSK